MAFVTTFTCNHCGESREEVVVPGRICAKCRRELAQIKEDAYMSARSLMPLEERVRRIELELYRLHADERLKTLEAMNQRYA